MELFREVAPIILNKTQKAPQLFFEGLFYVLSIIYLPTEIKLANKR
jgi:hypothetical protein